MRGGDSADMRGGDGVVIISLLLFINEMFNVRDYKLRLFTSFLLAVGW